jgi:YVTN family beta-propeller protein
MAGLGAIAWSSEAMALTGQPLAYVANSGGTVSVIDTGDNTVVDTIQLGNGPSGVAVTPDGKRVYVVLNNSGSVSVIDTASNLVVGNPIPVGSSPQNVAMAPDGKRIYVANIASNSVSVIDTASNMVTGTISAGSRPLEVAVTPDGKRVYVALNNFGNPGSVSVIDTTSNMVVGNPIPVGYIPGRLAATPDGKHVYVPNEGSNTVSVIDTTSNTVVGNPIPVGSIPEGVAVTPDGTHVYITNYGSNTVSVIDTATNMVVGNPIPVGNSPGGIAVTPDGTRIYVANFLNGNISVIDTVSNMVVGTILAGSLPNYVGIISPPPGIPFLAFNAKLEINFRREPNRDAFHLQSTFTLSSTASNRIHPDTKPVKLQVGPFITTIAAGSFIPGKDGSYAYEGVIDGVRLRAKITLTGTLRYTFHVEVTDANLSGTINPVQVSLGVGGYAGLTSVNAIGLGRVAIKSDLIPR